MKSKGSKCKASGPSREVKREKNRPDDSFKPAVYEGIIRVSNPLESFVTVQDPNEGSFDIYIYGRRETNGALHKDKVEVITTGVFRSRLTRRANKKAKSQEAAAASESSSRRKPQSRSDSAGHKPRHNAQPGPSGPDPDVLSVETDSSISSKDSTSSERKQAKEPSPQQKHPTPKYTGVVVRLLESVTERAPIVGFIRPISYMRDLLKERIRKINLLQNKEPPLSRKDILVKNWLKAIGIGDQSAKLRTIAHSEKVHVNTKKLCFVPVQMIYPVMRISVNYMNNDIFLDRYAHDCNVPGHLLFGAMVDIRPNNEKNLRLVSMYGSFNQLNTVFSGFLDCFGLSSHRNINEYIKDRTIDTSSSKTEWERQTNRVTFDSKYYLVFTIDPPSACDLDDAIHVSFDSKSDVYEVGVHIADVYYYLQRHRDILKGMAKELCTSVYLPHTNFPMLPRLFSSCLCSLLPNQRRPTLSLLIKISSKGEIVESPKFVHGIITSSAKLSYDDVDELFEIMDSIDRKKASTSREPHLENYCQNSRVVEIMKKSSVFKNNRRRVLSSLLLLRKLNRVLRSIPPRSEAIRLFNVENYFEFKKETKDETCNHFDIIESGIQPEDKRDLLSIPNIELKFDISLKVPDHLNSAIVKGVTLSHSNSVSHSLIEELMLLANQAAAKFITENRPESECILRIHEGISEIKLENLITYLRKHGFSHIFKDNTTRANIVQGLHEIYKKYGLVYYCTICEMLRDIFSRAKYIVHDKDSRDSNISTDHFALNLSIYTHFTSPIRRIADILVHQTIYSILDGEPPPVPGITKESDDTDSSCTQDRSSVFSKEEYFEVCSRSNEKSNSSKNMERDSIGIFISQLASKFDSLIPSISCVNRIKASKLQAHSVLLYPTGFHNVLLVDSETLANNVVLLALLKKCPRVPSTIRHKDNKVELCWKLESQYVQIQTNKSGPPQKMKLSKYLSRINKLLDNPFQHKLLLDMDEKVVVQTIGIWSYIPVYLVPTNTLPPKIAIAPISPLNKNFYDQISRLN